MNVLLQSNLTRVISFPTEVTDESVEYVHIIPGTNQIKSQELDIIRKLKDFQEHLDNNSFFVVSDVRGNPVDIYEMNASQARETVKATDNTEILRKWEKNETRATVLSVIKEKLAAVKKERESAKKTV